ncbi:hypothetical protein BGW80DRAFT_1415340, partial [Lactifluus volemus]
AARRSLSSCDVASSFSSPQFWYGEIAFPKLSVTSTSVHQPSEGVERTKLIYHYEETHLGRLGAARFGIRQQEVIQDVPADSEDSDSFVVKCPRRDFWPRRTRVATKRVFSNLVEGQRILDTELLRRRTKAPSTAVGNVRSSRVPPRRRSESPSTR